MLRDILAYFSTGLVIVVLDLVWLNYASDELFRPRIGALMTEAPNYVAAGFFYLFFTLGIVVYGVEPALAAGDWRLALYNGAFIGFLAYMAFDLTCLAILRGWSLRVSLIDIAWGSFVAGLSAVAGYLLTCLLLPPV